MIELVTTGAVLWTLGLAYAMARDVWARHAKARHPSTVSRRRVSSR